MLEAPHLKAVAAVVRVAGIEVRRVEIQIEPVGTADRRRPTVPVVADVPRHALIARPAEVAVARGGHRADQTKAGSRSVRRRKETKPYGALR